jgi:hypothetical protein
MLTRKDLDRQRCRTPGCECSGIRFVANCHPEEGFQASYDKATGSLKLTCRVSGKHIESFSIARAL